MVQPLPAGAMRRRSLSPKQAEQYNATAQSLQDAAVAVRRALGQTNRASAGLDRAAMGFKETVTTLTPPVPPWCVQPGFFQSPVQSVLGQSISTPCLRHSQDPRAVHTTGAVVMHSGALRDGNSDPQRGFFDGDVAATHALVEDIWEKQLLSASVNRAFRKALFEATQTLAEIEGQCVDEGVSDLVNSMCEQLVAMPLPGEDSFHNKSGFKTPPYPACSWCVNSDQI